MLSSNEQNRIYQQAYVPEHIPDYVSAISGLKPYLLEDYLCYFHKDHLLFIGYPLGDNPVEVSRVYQAACERFSPRTVTLVAEEIFLERENVEGQPPDRYYRLHLPLKSLSTDVAYMVRRARREINVNIGTFGKAHKTMIKKFLATHELTPEQTHIFNHVRQYLKRSKTARLLDARKADQLVAFSVVDLGSARYAFYQFNFRSGKSAVPGASDLLFNEMVRLAQSGGKAAINLGLGIHTGIRRFKEKWGGEPFLSHNSALIHRKPPGFGKLASKL